MYKILKTADSTVVGITEKPTYIKVGKTGDYVPAVREEAQGIAYDNVVYNFEDKVIKEGAESVFTHEEDLGKILEDYATYQEVSEAIRTGVNEI